MEIDKAGLLDGSGRKMSFKESVAGELEKTQILPRRLIGVAWSTGTHSRSFEAD